MSDGEKETKTLWGRALRDDSGNELNWALGILGFVREPGSLEVEFGKEQLDHPDVAVLISIFGKRLGGKKVGRDEAQYIRLALGVIERDYPGLIESEAEG